LPEKIGAFGVGAYSLFSLTENPMVCSGGTDLAFEWAGDALLTRRAPSEANDTWTSFHLPARDPYGVPEMTGFGGFLASSLTFTLSLAKIEVFVDGRSALCIAKTFPRAPVVMVPPVENSWWSRRSIVLNSPTSIFSLKGQGGGLTEREILISARFGESDEATAHISSRLIAADVVTQCSPELVLRMERVTKKRPMKQFSLMLLLADEVSDLGASTGSDRVDQRKARDLLSHFAPRIGAGRLFIGFRTSQTTGFAVHLAAPFIPTVERESIDLVDPTLFQWNSELLHIAGVAMRLALEHRMSNIGTLYSKEVPERRRAEALRVERVARAVASVEEEPRKVTSCSETGAADSAAKSTLRESASRRRAGESDRGGSSFFSGLASFMGQAASEVKRIAVSVVDSISDDPSNLLSPADPQPSASAAEREAIGLMQCFVPQRTTPDSRIGQYVSRGFEGSLPNLSTPVLSCAGVVRGSDAFTGRCGMQAFFKLDGEGTSTPPALVRSVVLDNASDYVEHVCGVARGTLEHLASHLKTRTLAEDEALLLLVWFRQYERKVPNDAGKGSLLKDSVRVCFEGSPKVARLRDFSFFVVSKEMRKVPLPFETLPISFTARLSENVLSALFAELQFSRWSEWIVDHECLTAERSESADATRLAVFSCLAYGTRDHAGDYPAWLRLSLGSRRCLPIEGGMLEMPIDSYLPIADLKTFESQSRLPKVSSAVLKAAHVSKRFLVAVGVREAVSLDVLFTELDRLTWNQDPSGLVRYLCGVQAKLSRSEIQRLRESRYLPSTADKTLHAPAELILPVLPAPIMQDLSNVVPFLRGWREQGSSGGDEARFLCDFLGMKRKPALETILQIAADNNTSSSMRMKCIVFAASHLDYEGGSYAGLRFLPCRRRSPLKPVSDLPVLGLCRTSECFTDQACFEMGFWTVQHELEVAALHFKVAREPTGQQYGDALLEIVQGLKSARTSDSAKDATAWKVFAFLSSRAGSFSEREKSILCGTALVPVWSIQRASNGAEAKTLLWRRPGDVYFASAGSGASSSAITSCLFDTIPSNDFLRVIGTKDEPSLADLCELIVADPESVFERMGKQPERYEELLYRIAGQVGSLPRQLVAQLRRSPFLLATTLALIDSVEASSAEDATADDTVNVQKVTWTLACAPDIVVVDDSFLQRMFNPLVLPVGSSGLEAFYVEMGSTFISKAVSRRFQIPFDHRYVACESDLTLRLTDRILQRRALILETSTRPMARGASALLEPSSLRVRHVPSITAVYALKGQSRSQSVTCCSGQTLVGKAPPASPPLPSSARLVLYVTEDVDFFDVSDALARRLYADERCGLQEVFLLSQLLETTLSQLRARGFPVDRVVKADSSPAPRSPSPSSPVPVPSLATSTGPQPTGTCSNDGEASSGDGHYEILRQIFPDVDPGWLRQKIEESPGENGLRYLKELMQSSGYPHEESSKCSPSSADPGRRGGPKNTLPRSLVRAFKKRASGALSTPGIGRALLGSSSGGVADSTRGHAEPSVEQDKGSAVEPDDAHARDGLRQALNSAVLASSQVPACGVSSAASQAVVSQDRVPAPSCEIIPGHDLVPVGREGIAHAKTSQGLRVFASRLDRDVDESLRFCVEYWNMVERFGYLLKDLASVFRLETKTMAIFYAKTGRVIAFNASGSLFFNLRYYATLHDASSRDRPSREALIFWYTTTCHELAHNLAKEHDQRHGHYTETMVEEYFPRFLDWLREIGL
jgi:Protein of unknown function (DUF3684)